MVDTYMSWTPYNFAFNDPVGLNDPMGDDPTREEYAPGDPLGPNKNPFKPYGNTDSENRWSKGANGTGINLGENPGFSDEIWAIITAIVKIHNESGATKTVYSNVTGELTTYGSDGKVITKYGAGMLGGGGKPEGLFYSGAGLCKGSCS